MWSILQILGTLLVIFAITYIVFFYVYTPWSMSMTLIERGPINIKTVTNYNFIPALNTSDNYTFSFYIKPGVADRTRHANCHELDGIFPLMYWTDVFYFTQKIDQQKAILYVNQLGGNDFKSYTPIYCPKLSDLKWTMVTIVINGRKFDVLYNGKTVASKLVPNMPNITKSGKLKSGANMEGEIAYVSFNNRSMSPEEVMIEYTSTSDSRGKPYIDKLFDIGSMFSCPAGILCMFKPRTPPSSSRLSWSTPYG
jgi:hypothetical protein